MRLILIRLRLHRGQVYKGHGFILRRVNEKKVMLT